MFKKIAISTVLAILLTFSYGTVSAENATPEGESVLQKIKQKVESIRKNPKAYIGTVTDKTQDSVQIKNLLGKIQQIAIRDNVQFVKIAKTTTNIKFTDIALGDFIVAMGYMDGNSILDAKRVLLISPLENPKREIIFGEITFLQKKDMKVAKINKEEVVVSFPKSWKGPDIKDLDIGMNVLLIANEQDGKLMVRTIEIVTESATSTSTITPTMKVKVSTTPSIKQ